MTKLIPADERSVAIPAGTGIDLPGILAWPNHPGAMVLFVHGSGSGRLSPRNNAVAQRLRSEGLATLLFDLLTEEEAVDRVNVFDIDLLAKRLLSATEWLSLQPEPGALPTGYFGASTGAAAALKAAAVSRIEIGAVVSRGGRPDLASEALPRVRAPTLLLVGSRDPQVLDLNREAMRRMTGVVNLVVVPGATHLFEEPGTLEEVGRLAGSWFVRHLRGQAIGGKG